MSDRLRKRKTEGRTLTLKVKFANCQQITRSKTLPMSIADSPTIEAIVCELLATVEFENRLVHPLGITLSNLDQPETASTYVQLTLGFWRYVKPALSLGDRSAEAGRD